MATSNTSFWQLIERNKICIPIIQRDYAQGREEEEEKRNKFLDKIAEHITKNKKMHLDFVYGKVKNQVFYPIDGQQRLTTLFLIHWYFSIKENIDVDKKSKLTRFFYDTRISSREFCNAIVVEEIEIPNKTGDNLFLNAIKNQYWFRSSWTNDPTIKAMLIMIQAIHDKFYAINGTPVFHQLEKENNITFEVLDLGAKDFELTDELYIKMNARGKQLSPFENFKANFIQLIEKYFKDAKCEHPFKGEISYSGYFSYKIEKEWTDLFWAFRGEETVIDKKIYSYFEYVAQMCYFKKYKEAKADSFNNSFAQYEDIFQNEENLLFLFNSLDKLHEISLNNSIVDRKNIEVFFQDLNSVSKFFWNSGDNPNLFELIITNVKKNEDSSNKILFYGILNFMIKDGTVKSEIPLNKFVRVFRNLMQATRQRNETKYNTNIRINNFGSYWMLLEQFFTDDLYSTLVSNSIDNRGTQISDASLKNEVEKASVLLTNGYEVNRALIGLEEFEYFEGLIHLLKPKELFQDFPIYLQCFKEIFDNTISSSQKIRALVACGFEGIYIKNCRMGEMWYFGKNQNWSTVLTTEDNNVSKNILELIQEYSQLEGNTEIKLDTIINSWLENNPNDRTWKHYFIKYPEFTSKRNYFVWPNDYEMRMLGTEGSNPLLASHISPFVLTVCQKINNTNICNANDCYLQYSGHSPLILKNGVTLTSTQQGWLIDKNNFIPTAEIVNKYRLEEEMGNYILKEIDERDRIALVIDFINDISNLL